MFIFPIFDIIAYWFFFPLLWQTHANLVFNREYDPHGPAYAFKYTVVLHPRWPHLFSLYGRGKTLWAACVQAECQLNDWEHESHTVEVR